jgi:hypothetical protein
MHHGTAVTTKKKAAYRIDCTLSGRFPFGDMADISQKRDTRPLFKEKTLNSYNKGVH